MISIHRKLVVDEHGRPQEVIIPWKEYQEIEELLGLDLNGKTLEILQEARKDRESGNKEAYVDLDTL